MEAGRLWRRKEERENCEGEAEEEEEKWEA